jgi:transposase
MPCVDLHLDCPDLNVTDCSIDSNTVTVDAEIVTSTATCPDCGHDSARVHSRYRRSITDLPSHGRQLVVRLAARRFYCPRRECRRRVFCERLSGLAAPHARTSFPLAESHREIGFALGGEAGARLAEKLAMPTSPDTLLRRVKSAPDEPAPPPRYVGVDDWAIRRGHNYGTILIDLERHCVIDILPGRDGEELKKWLKDHPGVEVIARDRWTAFANAAAEGAPQAKQVADRWHLLKNLREMVERLFARHPEEIRQATEAGVPQPAPVPVGMDGTAAPSPLGSAPAPPAEPADSPAEPTVREQTRTTQETARDERYRLVRELRDHGQSLRQIAGQVHLSRPTVIRYLREPQCPSAGRRGPRPSRLDEHQGFIADWVAQGGRNASELHRLLREKGCRVGYTVVRMYANRWLGSSGRPGVRRDAIPPPTPRPPSARKLSFAFLCPKARDGGTEPGVLDRLRASVPGLGKALDLAAEFAAMVRKTLAQPLPLWLSKVNESGSADLASFAAGLRADEAAVASALTEPWSSGQVEGQVNRLKLIKRTGYGRAGLPLLRARVRRKG